MPRWFLAIALVGCGHIGFDPIADGDAGAPGGAPSAPRWDLVQTAGSGNTTVTMKSLGAGHLVLIGVEIDSGGGMTKVTDSCNSYVALSTANATCSGFQTDLQIFYAFAKPSCQADTIRVQATQDVCAVVVWEVSGIRADDPVDAVAVLNDQPRSTTPLGPKITTSAAGEFVMASAVVEFTASGIHPGNEFTNDQDSDDNGWAHLTDPQAPAGTYQAQWDSDPGRYCASAVAFRVGP